MSTPPPSDQQALLLDDRKGKFVLERVEVPRPSPGQLLLKVKATALNPVDWKIQKFGGIFVTEYPAILGTDMSGEVVAIGEGITKFKVGDSVFCQGRYTNDYATFQQYTLADEYHLAKLPSNITHDEAATIPLGLTTAFVGMYNATPYGIAMVNPVKPEGLGHYEGEPFVVLGGASSVGQFAIQLAKISGFSPIIVSASLKHTKFLQSLGATHVLDRHLSKESVNTSIKEITSKPVKFVYDAISTSETQKTGIEIVAPGGNMIIVQPASVTSQDKHVTSIWAIRQLDQNHELMKGVYAKLTEWVETGLIKPNKVDLLPNGLAGIVEGLERMENDQVSGVKLVARPEETPA